MPEGTGLSPPKDKKAYQEDLLLKAGVLKEDDSGNVAKWERYRPENED